MKYSVENLTKKIDKNKKRRRIISNIIYIVLVFFLIINIIFVIQTMINSKKVPNLFGYKTFSIITGSMEPVIQVNDLIITKNCKEADIKKGDIISFRRGDTIITHEVYDIVEDSGRIRYITKGKTNYVLDEQEVKYKDIEGKYVGRIPKIGKIFNIFKNGNVIIGIIVFLLILNYLNGKKNKEKIIRQQQRRKYEKKQRGRRKFKLSTLKKL